MEGLFYIPEDSSELEQKVNQLIKQLGTNGLYLFYLTAEAHKRGMIPQSK
jgi:hypothetical protein